ncbi:MAG: homoserine O-succinyltransferase [SAR324 cluster bacterium]|uniref:Homoserine O-acetyltransferase n=1 Tax=SAR324 cluster bacterium TaxID=2024889 RepID=A0A2A4T7G3_9DELT|nr:MAG: homoserine O-succinyltransferase [SAR324 cluster bacterium]
MTIILPENYHAQKALEANNITCIHKEAALRQDIRPLRIGIMNVMPNVESYEFNLLYPMGKSILQIDPVWIKLDTHGYKSSSQKHMEDSYVSFEDAIYPNHLDGLILTGAPVEGLRFSDIKYWPEIERVLKYARKNISSTLGICWGAMALAHMLGIEKTIFETKLFGVFRTKNLDRNHPITGDLDDYFQCPQSRHAGYTDENLEAARDRGEVRLLAHNADAGYTIMESTDDRYLMHLGHPEYNSGRLVEETLRDRAKGRTDVEDPANFNVEDPSNCWRSHRNEFFSQWIKYVYLQTAF